MLLEAEVLAQRVGEGGGAMGVVRGVDEHGRLGADELQPPGEVAVARPLGEDVAHEGLGAAAEEGLDGRIASAALWAWWVPYSGRNSSS